MKNILIMAPRMNGPGNGSRLNSYWPKWLDSTIHNSLWKMFNPAILLLAALTDRSKYIIHVIDEEFQEVDMKHQYDIVAMYTITPNVQRAYMWSEYFMKTGATVVIGGVHASVCPEEVGRHANVVMIGEAEYIWPKFLSDFESGSTQSLYIQPLGTVDVERSPVPDFDLIPQNGRNIIPVQTSRGCLHNCSFCNVRNLYGNKNRLKSINKLYEELSKVIELKNIRSVFFTDNNFFYNKKRASDITEIVENFNIMWSTNTDISFGEEDFLIRNAYNSGCRQVLIGFESINENNFFDIDNSFKSKYLKSYHDIIERIQSNGIGVVGCFIVGLDYDTDETFDRLYEFIFSTKLYGASITVCTPYPGTKMYSYYNNEKRMLSYDWNEYTIFQPVIEPLYLSLDDFNNKYEYLLRKIYSKEFIKCKTEYFENKISMLNVKVKQ